MDRRMQILDGLKLTQPGIEIGPSYNPLAPKREGFNVSIIDHLDQAALRQKYTGHNVDTSLIEPVDYVWSGESYADLVRGAKFDWVLASHVIEHATDLIGFLNDIGAILTPTGMLSLAIPDKRFCFDHYRSNSDLARVIDTHVLGGKWPTPGAAAEHFMNAAAIDNQIIWGANVNANPILIHSLEYAKAAYDDTIAKRKYHDVHSWTFSPASFRLLMDDLYRLGHIHLRETYPAIGGSGEFYIKLSLAGAGPRQTRQELAIQAAQER